ncbi:pyridoxamine 5'-phosphate oxidase family protein [Ralstonia pickettii]|nr:pyridoxamine 5'-phosphate oxidase family protein [Ralstonia pickettii]
MNQRAYPSDIAFTSTVKAIQTRHGSRELYASVEKGRGWHTTITPDCAAFIRQQTSVFLATANAAGQPYIQHRGGPRGFLHVLDAKTIAFADFAGNQQFITLGNLADNPKAYFFMIDYARRRRIKFWGTATVSEDLQLLEQLARKDYKAKPQRVIAFTVEAWDMNCPQHIPQRFDADDVRKVLEEKDERIRLLEEQVRELQEQATRASAQE